METLDIKVFQAEVNQRKADALAEQNAAIAAANARNKEDVAWANSWKKENTDFLARMLKDKQISKADHDNEVKSINAQHASYVKDFKFSLDTAISGAKEYYTGQVKEADLYLKDRQADIAREQADLKKQFETQKQLAAQAQKNALADLAFEKALYAPADYTKKVAEVNADYARINDALATAYTTIQTADQDRRSQYIGGGIGSLSYSQELLAKSKAALPPPTPVPGASEALPAPLKLSTNMPTAISGPAPSPVSTPSQLTGTGAAPTTISAEEQARARAAITSGIGTSPALPSFPTMPSAPTGPQQPPPTGPSPYGDIFSKEQQFPSLLEGASNPYMQQQPLVPNLTPQPLQAGGTFPGLQQTTGQTMPAQPALPALTTGTGIVPTNPYLDAYQGMVQSARPPEEEVPGVPTPVAPVTSPVAQTTGMF